MKDSIIFSIVAILIILGWGMLWIGYRMDDLLEMPAGSRFLIRKDKCKILTKCLWFNNKETKCRFLIFAIIQEILGIMSIITGVVVIIVIIAIGSTREREVLRCIDAIMRKVHGIDFVYSILVVVFCKTYMHIHKKK